MKVIVTGGTGYIGSHTCVELIKKGHEIVIIDNLSNSKADVVDKIEKITGKRPVFYDADILDRNKIDKIFAANKVDAVIHFAGKKAVGESVEKPAVQNSFFPPRLQFTVRLKQFLSKRISHSLPRIPTELQSYILKGFYRIYIKQTKS